LKQHQSCSDFGRVIILQVNFSFVVIEACFQQRVSVRKKNPVVLFLAMNTNGNSFENFYRLRISNDGRRNLVLVESLFDVR